ncbi:MAG: CvpA family protein [Proteobacteria bacterium]|nr:CvpA family protein [Pseudomonadota bacterium]
MTVFDYVVLGIVLVSLAIGLWRGVIGEIIALVAWVLAFLAAQAWGEAVAQGIFAGIVDPAVRLVAAWVSIFVAVLVIMSLLRLAVRGLLKMLGLTLTDRLLGVLFGAARGLLIVLLLVAAAGMTAVPKEKWWSEAYFAPPLETAVLASKPWLPPDVAQRIRFR